MERQPTSPGDLQFADACEREFDFLVRRGFQVTRRESLLVRWERGTIYVEVFDDRSCLGVDLGRTDRPNEAYGLYDVLATFAPEETERSGWHATDTTSAEKGLAVLAGLVSRHGGPLLDGDEAAFAQLERKSSELRHATTMDATYGAIRDKAALAWEGKRLPEALVMHQPNLLDAPGASQRIVRIEQS